MGEWQPIRTIPKDGRVVMVSSCAPRPIFMELVNFVNGNWWHWPSMIYRGTLPDIYTHWQDPPAPPQEGSAE